MAEQAIVEAINKKSSKGSLRLRAGLMAVAVFCAVIAFVFLTLGLYLWLVSHVGATAAAFVMAAGYLLLGAVAIAMKVQASRRPRRASNQLDPSLVVLAVLGGLLNKNDSAETQAAKGADTQAGRSQG